MSNLYAGVNAAQQNRFTKDDYVRMRMELDTGKLSKDDYMLFYVRLLTNLVKKIIRDVANVPMADQRYEDLLCEGQAEILEKVMEYDPTVSAPSTFFMKHIEERIRSSVRPQGLSEYYETQVKKMKQMAYLAGYSGLDDTALTNAKLSALTGIPLSTVIEARRQAKYTVESLDAYDDNNFADERSMNPEDLFIKREDTKTLIDAMVCLTKLEKFMLLAMGAFNKNIMYILDYLKEPEQMSKFENELSGKKLTKEYLYNKYSSAVRRMKNELDDNLLEQKYRGKVMNIKLTGRPISLGDLFDTLFED